MRLAERLRAFLARRRASAAERGLKREEARAAYQRLRSPSGRPGRGKGGGVGGVWRPASRSDSSHSRRRAPAS
jgi:hypothetical protein